jgi:hypothetical protein
MVLSRTGWRIMRLLTLLGLLIHLLLVFRPDDNFMSRPFQEDAFYSLSVARSLAEGTGISVDGMQPTNGVQPLICFLYAPLFMMAGGDLHLALRMVMLLQVIILAGAVFAIAWFATTLLRSDQWKREIFWLTAMLVTWSYMLTNGMLNGLETGLAVAMVYTSAAYYNTRIASEKGNGIGRFFILGLLLGVGVLTRIDIGFFVAAILLAHLIRAHLLYSKLPGRERFAALGRTVVECFIIGATAVVVSLPWWIYNVLTFGSLVPISGQAQQMLFLDPLNNLEITGGVLLDSIMVLVNTPRIHGVTIPGVGPALFLLALAAIIIATRSGGIVRRAAAGWKNVWNAGAGASILIFGIALMIYYIFFFGAPHFIVRYLLPFRVLIVLGVISFLALLWRESGERRGLRGGLIVLLVAMSAVSIYGMSWNFIDHYTNLYIFPARWISENVKDGERVGMFQSGTTGFLHPATVVNLDGKVNVGALRALQRGGIATYVDSLRFDYLIDWEVFMAPVVGDPAVGGHYRAIDTLEGEFIIWKRME